MKLVSFLTPEMASKKQRRVLHRVILALINRWQIYHRFFDAMSGVKKLTNFMHEITYQSSANKSSIFGYLTFGHV